MKGKESRKKMRRMMGRKMEKSRSRRGRPGEEE